MRSLDWQPKFTGTKWRGQRLPAHARSVPCPEINEYH